MDVCPHCNSEVADDDNVLCTSCGNLLMESDTEDTTDSQSAVPTERQESGCPKCGNRETEVDEIATSGTGLSKYFDVQNRSFTVISCTSCGYSELYKGQSSGNAIDIFLG